MILTLTRSSLTSFILKWTATRVVLWRKVFLEILQNSQGSTCDSLCFLNKVTGWGTFTKEETLAKVFSGEISKSTILIEHLWAVASVKHKYQWQLWNSPSSHMTTYPGVDDSISSLQQQWLSLCEFCIGFGDYIVYKTLQIEAVLLKIGNAHFVRLPTCNNIWKQENSSRSSFQ